MGSQCDIVNALDFLPKARAEFISRGHELAYKYAPRLYGAGYRISEMMPQHSSLYEQNAKGADELCKKLFSGSYDVVISVHIFAAMMMTELRINREINIPSFLSQRITPARPAFRRSTRISILSPMKSCAMSLRRRA